jgi:hypothetical protein
MAKVQSFIDNFLDSTSSDKTLSCDRSTIPVLFRKLIFYGFIAENTAGDNGAENDDITNI